MVIKKTALVNNDLSDKKQAKQLSVASPVSFTSNNETLENKALPTRLASAEVNVKGVWQKVIIVDKESEYLYKVHYIGMSDSSDEWIPLSQIKNIDSSVTAPSLSKQEVKMASVVNCGFKPPVLPVSNSEQFSEKVAKRKVYEYLLSTRSKTGKKVGVNFLYFQERQAYANTVSVSATKELVFKNAAVPAGAMIYPVSTKYNLCENMNGNITTQILDGRFSCYRNQKGLWECAEEK